MAQFIAIEKIYHNNGIKLPTKEINLLNLDQIVNIQIAKERDTGNVVRLTARLWKFQESNSMRLYEWFWDEEVIALAYAIRKSDLNARFLNLLEEKVKNLPEPPPENLDEIPF